MFDVRFNIGDKLIFYLWKVLYNDIIVFDMIKKDYDF